MAKKKTISKKLDKHFQNKKKLAITLATTIVVAVLLIGTAFIYYEVTTTSTKNQTIAESDKPAADHLRKMATESIAKDNPQALALFKAAKMQYEYVVENTTNQAIKDDAQNGLIDCEAQMWMLEH